jgi:putative flippase GtrA
MIRKCPLYIPRFITAGLFEALVQVFNSPTFYSKYLTPLVSTICAYDESIIQQFLKLGIPEGSSFFDFQ